MTRGQSTRSGVVQIVLNLGHGGLESMVVALAVAIRQRGYPAAVIALDAGGAHEATLEAAGVSVHVLGGRNWMRPEHHLRLTRVLKHLAPAAVHTHHFAPLAHSALAVTASGSRLVHTEHSFQYLEHRPDYRRALQALSWLCKHFVVVGDVMEPYYREVVRVSPRRLQVIHNGITPAPIMPVEALASGRLSLGPPGAFLVGTAGRLFPEKDHATLLQAAALAQREVPNLRIVLIGDGPLREPLERLTHELGLESRVFFAGWREDVRALLPLLDCFALTSISEGLPLVVLEAISAGTPVISTAVGDLPAVLEHGAAGTLVPVGSAEATADAIVAHARDPQAAALRAARAARVCDQGYGHRQMVDRYLESYGLAAA